MKAYSFTYNDEKGLKQMYKGAKEGFAENFTFTSQYKEYSFEDQDEWAINALKSAKEKAMHIAKLRGYSDVKLVSIDDNTSSVLGLRKTFELPKSITNFNRKGKNKGYNLNVRYELLK